MFAAAAAYIAWRNLKATQEKQVAERFSKAVEQLGSENIHVRLGGIYALEQIAKDAEEKYYWQVMEMLTSYARHRSSINNETNEPITTDIGQAVRVLAQRRYGYQHPMEPNRLNLREVNLRGLQLPPKSKLQGIDFTGTNLQKANLSKVYLQNAVLVDADLRNAYFSEAIMTRSEMSGADLKGAKFFKANLQEAEFGATDLRGSYLEAANLEKAKFIQAKLQDTDLSHTILRKANFWGANLLGTKFLGADLHQAEFNKSHLSISQDSLNLTWEQITQAKSYTKELLPKYLLNQQTEK